MCALIGSQRQVASVRRSVIGHDFLPRVHSLPLQTDGGAARSPSEGGAIFLKSHPFINPQTQTDPPSSDAQVSGGLTGFQVRVEEGGG